MTVPNEPTEEERKRQEQQAEAFENLIQEKIGLLNQLIKHSGLTAKAAQELVEWKYLQPGGGLEKDFFNPKYLPYELLPMAVTGYGFHGDVKWEDLDKETKSKILWQLGFNTLKFSWVETVQCYKFQGETRCGKVLIGEDRYPASSL